MIQPHYLSAEEFLSEGQANKSTMDGKWMKASLYLCGLSEDEDIPEDLYYQDNGEESDSIDTGKEED